MPTPLLDEARIAFLVGHHSAMADQLLHAFLSDSKDIFLHANNAIGGNDRAELARALHRLKGISANIGLALLAEAARSAEQEIKEGETPLAAIFANVIDHYAAAEAALKHRLGAS